MGKGQLCALNANRRRFENMSDEDIKKFKERQKERSKVHYNKNKERLNKRKRFIRFVAKEVIDKEVELFIL